MSLTIGIDLGTSNSAVAYVDGRNNPVCIDIGAGLRIMPSAVAMRGDEVIVGSAALDEGRGHKPDTYLFRKWKRKMGRRWRSEEDNGPDAIEGPDGMLALQGPDGRVVTPEELSAHVIRRLVDAAQDRMEEKKRPTGAVITVPADFGAMARAATEDAARLAGLDHVFIMNEPTAAATAHGFGKKQAATLALYDLGAGTFDISIISARAGDIKVRSTMGNRELGGDDFDAAFADWIIARYMEDTGEDLNQRDDILRLRILEEAERVKIALSEREIVRFEVSRIDYSDGVKHLAYDVTREEFESIPAIVRMVDETLELCQRALLDANPKLSIDDIQAVQLVGGMTMMPLIARRVSEFFGKTAASTINPYEVVAMGAAIKAAEIDGRIPTRVRDIGSKSISFETINDLVHVVTTHGEAIPSETTVTLTNAEDNQQRISLNFYEGDSIRASKNEVLVRDYIEIEPGPARSAMVSVTVRRLLSGITEIDVEGVRIFPPVRNETEDVVEEGAHE
jgi:molecular chaperone DnaK